MAISVYQCGACEFTFERAGEVSSCPDCGSSDVRIATEAEQSDYKRIKAELAAEHTAKCERG